MITHLTIQNFGLIDKLSIELGENLTALTGETGAGKSILIGALRYALGERFHSDHARDPKLPCVVEAVFELSRQFVEDNPSLTEFLEDADRQIIIHRSVAPDGKNKIRINGFSVTLSQLKSIGDHLVDFHGPNDHQMLLEASSHARILDRLSPAAPALKVAYAGVYDEYKQLHRRLEEIKEGGLSRDREMDLLSHQIRELERASLDPKKYQEIMEKETQIKNRERLYESVSALTRLFENEETGIDETVSKAFPLIRSLVSIDKNAGGLEEQIKNLQTLSGDILAALRQYEDSLSFEPEDAKQWADLCDAYHDILRKYGPSIEIAADFYKKIKERHDFLINLDQNSADLDLRLKSVEKSLKNAGGSLTKERQKTARSLTSSIEAELKDLGIAHVRWECRITPADPGPDGADEVTFYVSPNLGEPLKPLAEIISSGEAARVMLALKKSLTRVDPVPVLVFDEIDAQIGGRLGTVIGQKLCQIAENRQVLVITHLPQIAGFASHHFKISKKISDQRTITTVDLLDRAGRVKEMAQMMSGSKESGISLTHAEEMLAKAKK